MMSRNSKIELTRFVAAIFIAIGHMDIQNSLLSTGWIYVDFFFMISGFYAIKHIKESDYKLCLNDKCVYSIKYTFNKFSKIFPYIVIPITLHCLASAVREYFYEGSNIYTVIKELLSIPFELTFLSQIYTTISAPTWFLSIMFMFFPIFMLIILYSNKHIVKLIMAYISFYIYFFIPNYHYHTFKLHLLRCMAGLFAGAVLYKISEYFKRRYKFNNFSILFFEIFLLLCPPLILPILKLNNTTFVVISFILYILCVNINSNTLFTNINFFNFLGKLSLPIYTWHFLIYNAVNLININNACIKYSFVFILIFICSIFNIYIIRYKNLR